MRLKQTDREAIVETVHEVFGPEARTFLFGSRTDDRKFGGDIDLLVEVEAQSRDWIEATIRAAALIKLRIGDRKLDLVVTDRSPLREAQLIIRNAREQGALL